MNLIKTIPESEIEWSILFEATNMTKFDNFPTVSGSLDSKLFPMFRF